MAAGLSPCTDCREGLAVLSVLDACQQSLEMGGVVVRPGLSALNVVQAQSYSVHPTAIVDEGCSIGQDTRIWHFAHIIPGQPHRRQLQPGPERHGGPLYL